MIRLGRLGRPGLIVALVGLSAQAAYALERALPMGLYVASGGPSLAMQDSRIDVTVRGPIVETVVVQRFRNTSGRAIEATYIFPLPADAAVSAMAMQIGARTIHAAIEPRDAAQRRYEAAVAAGAAAALLEQERPDVFTQTVAAIPANGVVEVTLRYDTLARYEAGTWTLVVPMVVAPRHVPGTASGRATTGSGRAPDTDRAPDASRVTPAASPGTGGSTAVTIHFTDEPSELESPTHELGGTRRDATLSDPRSDHDAIIRWRAPAPSAGWVERDGEAGFAAVVIEAPPAAPKQAAIRVILAIDRSATTRGDASAVEHPLVRALLGALDRADRVRVIGSDAIAWNAPDDAYKAIERVWARPAGVFDLTRVLASAAPEGAAIVLVSDGLVADDADAIAAARRLGVPIHVVGIGPAPARATLQQISAATGGTVRYAVAGDDVTALARGVLADVASPPAPLKINWGTLAASDVEPAVLPRLGAGQAMLVLARVKHVQAANARARGELFAFETLAPGAAIEGATTPRGPLARRWARERLGDLVAGKHDRNAVISLALAYGLVSPYTSLVAIGSDAIVQGGVKHSVAVPVSLPAGMQWHAVKHALEVDIGRDTSVAPVPEPSPAADGRVAPAAPATKASPAPPAPAKHRPPTSGKAGKADGEAGDDGEARPAHKKYKSADEDARSVRKEPRPPHKQPEPAAPPPAADLDASRVNDAEDTGGAPEEAREVVKASRGEDRISVAGRTFTSEQAAEAIELEGAMSPRAFRLTAALGGGLAFDHGSRGLLALDVRLETTRRTRFGVEAALWLVGGSDPEGRGLVTVAHGLVRWFELGVGAGLQFGNGTGVASSLRLRANTPIAWLAGTLRYDAAVLLTRPSLEAEHALTLGVELSY
ncbi:MAG TPA: VIT domain-containing protein [Kofleriaceae bacterium]|jgi:Ca-activated chloride channel family protein|nr:VIT domain-containing protein [Kofleriaceae bacterium]